MKFLAGARALLTLRASSTVIEGKTRAALAGFVIDIVARLETELWRR
jgi:hypothetical protein